MKKDWAKDAVEYALNWWIDYSFFNFGQELQEEIENWEEYSDLNLGYFSEDCKIIVDENENNAFNFKITLKKELEFDDLYELAERANTLKLVDESGARHFQEYYEKLIIFLDEFLKIEFSKITDKIKKSEIESIVSIRKCNFDLPEDISNFILKNQY